MADTYRVWIEVEHCHNEGAPGEFYRKCDVEFASSAAFDDEEYAKAFATKLHRIAGVLEELSPESNTSCQGKALAELLVIMS